MMRDFRTVCTLGAALVIAAAGIFDLIDQTTMMTLVIVLVVCCPESRRCHLPGASA